MFSNYLSDILKTTQAGNVREESYYSDLKKLIEVYALQNKKEINVTTLPKKTEAGNPDFRIQTQKYQLVGYIEAKEPNNENLDAVEQTEQLQRYLKTFPNLILTNFLEFRLYRNGEQIDKVIIGRSFILNQLSALPPIENELYLQKLLAEFFSFSTPKINTAKTLAIELAKRTSFLKDNCIYEELKEENLTGIQTLEGIYKLFKEYLISSLTLDEFSNLFSQTITFGLFAARLKSTPDFNRLNAFKNIPPTIGVLRSIFRFISSNDLPKTMEWVIDDIAELLKNTDVAKIVDNYYHNGKGNDPIIHFYETFLTEYDPKERAKRGVYYTPEPVVKYIVRSIHKILQKKFKRPDGLASNSVTLLDPAAGTLTFPVEAIKVAIEEYKKRYGDGGVNNLIKNHIIPHFFAFELMMSPYVLGHLKVSLVFDEHNYKLGSHERFNLFLTNTLDFNNLLYMELPLFSDLSEESRQANDIKKNKKVMVVLGNPPYSVSSSNKIKEGSEFYDLYESYKEKVRKEEKNIQPLSDDYIKFLAYAHWKVLQSGKGIVGFITNNSYLNGLIHRDIRKKLIDDFDDIYILNLHGSSQKKEDKPTSVVKDENVFDIRQGVSIVLLVKDGGLRKVSYFDLWGTREQKYSFLESKSFQDIEWEKIIPIEPFFFLENKKFINSEQYDTFILLDKIFDQYTASIVTGKDKVLIDFSENILKNRMISIMDNSTKNEFLTDVYELTNSAGNKIITERLKTNFDESKILKYHYRPLDYRYIYFEPKFLERHRPYISSFMLDENLSINISRLTANSSFSNIIVSDSLADYKLAENSRGSYFFPLFTYNKKSGFEDEIVKSININWSNLPSFIQTLQPFKSKITNNFILPEQAIFYYIYAILYSNIYREKYKEFLKIDFPRIPFTKNIEILQSLSSLGEELVNLHLLKSLRLDNPTTRFFGQGEGNVTKIKYDPKTKRVYINDNQYFDNIESNIWLYYIGGYQVLDKWLKSRVKQTLLDEDIRYYCKVVTVIKITKEIQEKIDRLYMETEKEVL